MIKTTIYAQISRESAYEKGEAIGLKREALKLFSWFNEVELEIEVEDDGRVSKITAVEV